MSHQYTVSIDDADAGTILAALRLYQHYLFTGKWPEGTTLQAIFAIAGDWSEAMPTGPLSPEDIDGLCQKINDGNAPKC